MSRELDKLMQQFAALGDAVVGSGPLHPSAPHPELQTEIDVFLAIYPALRRDLDYLAFLQTYAGAGVGPPANELGLHILLPGFQHECGMRVDDAEWEWLQELVQGQGFLTFAMVEVPGQGPPADDGFINMSFYFDLTGMRRPGVYGNLDEAPIVWFCDGFLTWLRLLIETRGHLYADLPGVTGRAAAE